MAVTLYWYGGSGLASSASGHWSTNSGNSPAADHIAPVAGDTIITDALSDGGAGAYQITQDMNLDLAGATIGAPSSGNLTWVTDANKTRQILLRGGITITGTPNIGGNSPINRLLICSNTIGTARTITNTGATVAWTNTDFKDITMSSAIDLSAQTDIGGGTALTGCSGITFPATQNCYWVAGSTGTKAWSTLTGAVGTYWMTTSGGSTKTRVPLIQDLAVFDNNSFPAGTSAVTQDMPRIPSTTWAGDDGAHPVNNASVSFTTSTAASVFGSMTLTTGMTLAATAQTYTFEGRGSYTLTSAGKDWNRIIYFDAPTGTLALQDAFNTNGNNLYINNGTFDAGSNNVTIAGMNSSNNTYVRTISGSGLWTLGHNTSFWAAFNSTGLTTNLSNSTIKSVGTSAQGKTFDGGGKTYGNLWFANGSAGAPYKITGTNTFTGYIKDDGTAAHSITFPNVTTTVADWQIKGNASAPITIQRTGASGTANVSKSTAGPIIGIDYLIVSDVTATQTNTWYAGSNSSGVGTTTNWIFAPAFRAAWAIRQQRVIGGGTI